MGYDTVIYLPPHVDDDDVCEMMAICAGAKAYRRDFGGNHKGWSAVVEGVSYQAEGLGRFPNMVLTKFKDAQGQERQVNYFCRHGATGGPMLRPRSTPFWLAVGRRLIGVFGGQLRHDDGSDEINEEVDPSKAELSAEDYDESNGNEGFYRRQEALMRALPLSPKELIAASQVAAYPYETNAKGKPAGAEALAELDAFKKVRLRYERVAREATALEAVTEAPAPRPKRAIAKRAL